MSGRKKTRLNVSNTFIQVSDYFRARTRFTNAALRIQTIVFYIYKGRRSFIPESYINYVASVVKPKDGINLCSVCCGAKVLLLYSAANTNRFGIFRPCSTRQKLARVSGVGSDVPLSVDGRTPKRRQVLVKIAKRFKF